MSSFNNVADKNSEGVVIAGWMFSNTKEAEEV